MEERRFDDLTRRLATPKSRRGVLKAVVVGVAASALGAFGGNVAAQGNSDAAHFCTTVYPPGPARGTCVNDAAHGTGLYTQCGGNPANVCSGPNGPFCPDFSSDTTNCGGCGVTCTSDETCTGGGCVAVCQAPTSACNGQCVDFSQDSNNCGQCGAACTRDETCTDGSCVPLCQAPTTYCNGQCVDLTYDGANCGGCGNACPATQVCNSGTCGCESFKEQCGGMCFYPCSQEFGQVRNTTTCQCECPTGTVTLDSGWCLQACSTDSDCGEGHFCDTTTEGQRVCNEAGYLPYCSPCTSSDGCQSGCFAANAYCSANDHLCH